MATKKYRPPMWSSKVHGEPHGIWESDAPVDDAGQTEHQMEALRVVVKSKLTHRQHQTARTYLLTILRLGDTGSKQGQKLTGKISPQSFQMLLQRKLQFSLTAEETQRLFRTYGHDENGNMPYDMFCWRLFTGKFKVMAREGFQQGAYTVDRPQDWRFKGMIKYPFLTKAVMAPTDWDPELARRSARAPSLSLRLEHVFGYSGLQNVSPNLFYTNRGDVVYYTAGVGVVYNDDDNEQRFFLGHDDDICCLGVAPPAPDRPKATCETIVATGQFGASPRVFVWSADTQRGPDGRDEPVMLQLPYGARSVCCLCFSQNGEQLVTVSTDQTHTITLWDWRADPGRQVLATANGLTGDPTQINGVVWNPWRTNGNSTLASASEYDFVSFGVKHIKFWSYDKSTGALTADGCTFDQCEQQDIYHAAFLPSEPAVVTGGPDGKLTCWLKNKARAEFSLHVKDLRAMKVIARDETGMMTCALDAPNDPLFSNQAVKQWQIVTAGGASYHVNIRLDLLRNQSDIQLRVAMVAGDGVIRESVLNWEDSDNLKVTDSTLQNTGPFTLGGNGDVPGVISLDCLDGFIVAGTDGNDIWEVDADPQVMVEGQSGAVTGIAPHPLRPNLYCTACGDGSVYVWDSVLRKSLRSFEIRRGRDSHGPGVQNAPRTNDNLKVRGKKPIMKAGELLRPKVCCFSNQGDLFAIGTGGDFGGVVGSPDHPDKGGVIQVFAVTAEMFQPEELHDGEAEWAPTKLCELHEAAEGIEAVRFSPDGRLLAAADRDNFINIYNVEDGFRRVGKCVGHSSAVLQVDWSADGKMLMSNSMDHEVKYWDRRGRPTADQTQRDQIWDSWTCQLGFPVMGIWDDNMDGTDINSVHRSQRGGHLVATDDSGGVRLLNYPCVIDKAPAKVYGGHCSHVPNVRWLAGDKQVVSVGGHDQTLFQWVVEGDDDTPPDYGVAAKGADKAALAAARRDNEKKEEQDREEERYQQKLTHRTRPNRSGRQPGSGAGVREALGKVAGAGAGKLRVNLRVKELQGVVRSYSEQLRVLQSEINDLELEQIMDAERDDAIVAAES